MSRVGKVWPPTTSPAPSGEQADSGSGSTMSIPGGKKGLMAAGAVLVAGLAFMSSRKDKGSEDEYDTEVDPATYDGLSTDIASSMEELGSQVSGSVTDSIGDLTDVITDRLPVSEPPDTSTPTPTPVKPAPKPRAPVGPKVYTVKAGDTLRALAAKNKLTVNRLYERNQTAIQNAAKAHNVKDWKKSRRLFKGTTLVIPAK